MNRKVGTRESHHKVREDLVATLSRQASIYEELLEVMRQKQRAVIDGDVERLEKVVSEEHFLVREARTAGEMMKSQLRNVAEAFGCSGTDMTLMRLARLFEKDSEAGMAFGRELSPLRERLRKSCELISLTNEENRYLLGASLNFVREFVHVLLKADEESGLMYSVDGVVDAMENPNKVLDYQI